MATSGALAKPGPTQTPAEKRPDKDHFDRGRSFEKAQWYEEAIREFQAAIDANSNDVHYYDNLGFCLKELRRYDEAVNAFNLATSINPRDTYAHRELGITYFDKGDFSRATDKLKECIALDPSDSSTWFWLGYIYYKAKKQTESIQAFDEALKLKPEDFDSNYWRGLGLLGANRVDEADRSLAKAVEIRPKDFNANLWRGMCLARKQDFRNAAESFEKAHQIKPDDKVTRFQLFACYLASSQTDKAARVYPKLILEIGVFLALLYAVWFAALLPFSLPVRDKPSPGIWFSLAWLGLFFEGQAAFLLLLASLPSLRWHETVFSGAMLSGLPIILVALTGFARQPWGEPFQWPPRFGSVQLVLVCIGCIFGALLVSNGFAILYRYATNNPFPMQRTIPLIQTALKVNPIAAWLGVVLVIPCVEEIIFRGLLFGAFQKFWGITGAVLASSVVFVIIHLQIIGFLVLFLLGLTLAFARLRTASLGLPIALHGLNNAIAMLMLTFVHPQLTH